MAVATAIGLGLSVLGIALGFVPDQDMKELQKELDELDAKLTDLGDEILDELNIISDQFIANANSQARSAGDMLDRWRREENPSEQLAADTISESQAALNEVLGLVRTALGGADPAQALGYIGAITYALNVRVQVAHELEGGALGTNAIARSFAEAADIFEQMHDLMPATIEEQVGTSSSESVSYSLGDYIFGVPTSIVVTLTETVTVKSGLTGETRTKSFSWSDKITGTDLATIWLPILTNPAELILIALGEIPKPSSVASSISSFVSQSTDQIVDHDMAHFDFDDLPELAAGYDDLSDGDDILGTSGRDKLQGTDGIDLLTGLQGDDVLKGRNDHDVLRGGSGDDELLGGGGNDRLEGGGGLDYLKGGDGDDLLIGGAGSDKLVGSGGRDRLEGGDGKDVLNGENGKDVLIGGNGSDELSGGDGDDLLLGEVGADVLRGGAGKDEMRGGDGADWLEGGNGRDLLEGGKGDDTFVLNGKNPDDIIDFGLGSDTIVLDGAFFDGLNDGELAAGRFVDGEEATKDRAQIIYDDGRLYYDADGTGAGEAVKIAVLDDDPSLDASMIFIM